MKKLIYIFVIILFAQNSIGQNVGIGTTTPAAQLDVSGPEGNLLVHPWWSNPDGKTSVIATLHTITNTGAQLRFDGVGTKFVDAGMDSSGNFVIENQLDNGIITATQEGNVGIGTTSPQAKLDVEGSMRLADGTQAAGLVLTSDSNGVATWKKGASPSTEGLLCNLYFLLGQPEPGLCSRITGVTVTSNMGQCCGGALSAILDGSGLTPNSYLGLHDTNDYTSWKSDYSLTGFLLFDLQVTYNLQRLAIWNHGQLGGDRGVNGISIETSVDGVNFTPLPGGPDHLIKAVTAPVTAEKFVLASPVLARFIRFNISSGYGAVNTGLGEVMFWAN